MTPEYLKWKAEVEEAVKKWRDRVEKMTPEEREKDRREWMEFVKRRNQGLDRLKLRGGDAM